MYILYFSYNASKARLCVNTIIYTNSMYSTSDYPR